MIFWTSPDPYINCWLIPPYCWFNTPFAPGYIPHFFRLNHLVSYIWLVVDLPLWKIWKSVRIMKFPTGKSFKIPWFQSPPTRYFHGSIIWNPHFCWLNPYFLRQKFASSRVLKAAPPLALRPTSAKRQAPAWVMCSCHGMAVADGWMSRMPGNVTIWFWWMLGWFSPAGWCPPVISWFINPINYSYIYHKP